MGQPEPRRNPLHKTVIRVSSGPGATRACVAKPAEISYSFSKSQERQVLTTPTEIQSLSANAERGESQTVTRTTDPVWDRDWDNYFGVSLNSEQTQYPNFQRAPVKLASFSQSIKDQCFSCKKLVYPLEKVGPIRDALYHKLCFRCAYCNSLLSLQTFHQNGNDVKDKKVYCKSHIPLRETLTGSVIDKTMETAMHRPRIDNVNTNIRGGADAGKGAAFDFNSLAIKGALEVPRLNMVNDQIRSGVQQGKTANFGIRSVSIQSALNAPKARAMRYDAVRPTYHFCSVGPDSLQIQAALHAPKI